MCELCGMVAKTDVYMEMDGIEEAVDLFRRDELSRLLAKSRELNEYILGMEKYQEKILKSSNVMAPAIHLAHQHLEVITDSVHQQALELERLVGYLQEENMVELQKTEKYHSLQNERREQIEAIMPCLLLYIALQRRYPEILA